jgi:hypothetical protein
MSMMPAPRVSAENWRVLGVGDHRPEVVADDVDILEAQVLHERVDILGGRRLVASGSRGGGGADAADVRAITM